MGNDSLIKIEKNELIISNQDKRQKIDLNTLQLIENDYVLVAEETYDPPTTSLDENGKEYRMQFMDMELRWQKLQ